MPTVADDFLTGPQPTYALVIAELKLIRASLRRLEDEALRLMAEAGVTQQDIADELGITPQAVGKRQRRPRGSGPQSGN